MSASAIREQYGGRPENLHIDRRLEHEKDVVAVVLNRPVAIAAKIEG